MTQRRTPRLPLIGLSATFGLMSACITPKEKRLMQDDIMDAQTRLTAIEQEVLQSSKQAQDSANKRLANNQTTLDKIALDLQKIRGELDSLRVGVVTGQMPGTDPNRETSIASAIADLTERVDTLEKDQQEILSTIKKAGRRSTPKKKARTVAKTSSDLQKNFDRKRYTQVTEDAGQVVKKARGNKKELAMYLWGESLFRLGKTRDAALKFNEMIETSSSKKYLPQAKMRMGDCFKALGDTATAKLYYEELVAEFPNSTEAKKAKDHLSKLAKAG